jgi:hypothetical protein
MNDCGFFKRDDDDTIIELTVLGERRVGRTKERLENEIENVTQAMNLYLCGQWRPSERKNKIYCLCGKVRMVISNLSTAATR